MLVKESKNLTFDKRPFIVGPASGFDHLDPSVCVLERSERVDDKLVLYFKNGTKASVKALNIEGGREVDEIEKRMIDFIGKTYEELLESKI